MGHVILKRRIEALLFGVLVEKLFSYLDLCIIEDEICGPALLIF